MIRKLEKSEYIKPELTIQELSEALYQVNKKLKKSNEDLLQSQRELTEVFSNISHDLRSPVTAILNSVEYLLSVDTMDMNEIRSIIKLMHGRAIYLDQLINDIFILSAIDSSNKVFHYEKVNIGMFLEDYFFCCKADRKYDKRSLSLEVPEYFPYMVMIDCKMMLRVLDNLLTNALHYSEEGASIVLSAEAMDNGTVLASVTDTGHGIAPEHLSRIFDRTYMIESARTPGKYSGCGLGLAIAKSIIVNHGGKIWCESEKGRGSSFKFTLPFAACEQML